MTEASSTTDPSCRSVSSSYIVGRGYNVSTVSSTDEDEHCTHLEGDQGTSLSQSTHWEDHLEIQILLKEAEEGEYRTQT